MSPQERGRLLFRNHDKKKHAKGKSLMNNYIDFMSVYSTSNEKKRYFKTINL